MRGIFSYKTADWPPNPFEDDPYDYHLADFLDSDSVWLCSVRQTGLIFRIAGRLAGPEHFEKCAAPPWKEATAAVLYVDEMMELWFSQHGRTERQRLETIAGIFKAKGEDPRRSVVDLEMSLEHVFGKPPGPLGRPQLEAHWEAWGKKTRREYLARRKWALARVPDSEEWRLAVANYAYARLVERELISGEDE